MTNDRRPRGETGDDAERHHGVADVVHVNVDAAQRPPLDCYPFALIAHLAAHLLQDLGETDIPLQ